MLSILFVCDTNISLSPLAAALFLNAAENAGLKHHFSVQTAGSHPGMAARPVDRRIIQLCSEHNIPCFATTSREVTLEDVKRSDLLIVMNENNFWHIKTLDPRVPGTKLRLIMEYSKQLAIREVPDPLLGETSFAEAYKILSSACDAFLERITKQFSLAVADN